MARGLSELQKGILVTMWKQRAACEWTRIYGEGERWIGPGSEGDWLEREHRDVFDNPNNWICEPPDGLRHLSLVYRLVPRDATKTERKRLLTSIRRAVQRLHDRGLITFACRNQSYADLALTPWGSLFGWLISEGRPMSHLAGRKLPMPNEGYDGPSLEQLGAELCALAGGQPLVHEMMVEQLQTMEPWQQQHVYEALKVMVETSPVAPLSTISSETGRLTVESSPSAEVSTDSACECRSV